MTTLVTTQAPGGPRYVLDVRYRDRYGDYYVKVRDGMPAIPVVHFDPTDVQPCNRIVQLRYMHCDN